MTASDVLLNGLETTFWVSLLTVIVLAARRPVSRFAGSGAAMLLWLIPGARLAMPALPKKVTADPLAQAAVTAPDSGAAAARLESSPGSVASSPGGDAGAASVVESAASTNLPADGGALAEASLRFGPAETNLVAAFVLCVWALGVIATMVLCWLRAQRWRRTLEAEGGRAPAEVAALAERVAARVGTERDFDLILSAAAETPQLMGARRPLIALPSDFTRRYTAAEQEMVLMHELTHLRRGDLRLLMVAEFAFATHWFNPLTPPARRALRADLESACDETVRALGVNTRRYAELLLKAACVSRAVPALTLDHGLKERIIRMHNPTRSRAVRLGFSLLAAVSALTLAGFTASRSDVAAVHPRHAVAEERQPGEDAGGDAGLEGLSEELKAAIRSERRDEARIRELAERARRDAAVEAALDALLHQDRHATENIVEDVRRALERVDGVGLSQGDIAAAERELRAALAGVEAERDHRHPRVRVLRMSAAGAAADADMPGEGSGADHGSVTIRVPDIAEHVSAMVGTIGPMVQHHVAIDGPDGADGMVLLGNPFEGISAPDAPAPSPPTLDAEPPEIQRRETEEGTWILVPDTRDIAAFEEKMEAFEARMEVFGEQMEAWGARMGRAGDAIGRLADRCEQHRRASDAPVILNENIAGESRVIRAVCATGGMDRFRSDEMARFIAGAHLPQDAIDAFRQAIGRD